MGYQALLFCPDEKTARPVTQVLSELEFAVEPCSEPFAAVKKLMGTHFDAIVVDCDNEQNAALLFKSARNSTCNQASLAVAVVEGQAGVAKAFRIGANLVLTKPINIEQTKGTLRVARGLLRKSDTGKPAAPSTPAPASPATPAPVPPVARSVTSAPAKTAARPAGTPPVSSSPVGRGQEARAIANSAVGASSVSKPAAPATLAPSSTAAASAPAPAREILDIPPAQAVPPGSAGEDDDILEVPAAAQPPAATEPTKQAPPSFTLSAASASPVSGRVRKIVLGIAAAVVVAAGSYFGWTRFQGHHSQSSGNPEPVELAHSSSKVSSPKPSSTGGIPTPSPEATGHSSATATSEAETAGESASENDRPTAVPSSSKPSASSVTDKAVPAASKGAPVTKGAVPLMVQGGAAPKAQLKAGASDAPAPSVIGIAAPGASAPPNLLAPANASKPLLQRLNISQGVSRGLLIKRVNPVYPANALRMRISGTVELLATISKTGDISDVQVLSGDRQLAAAAVDAVKRWKYQPYLLNGEPVEIQTQVTMTFKLPD
jgi:protein TonB